MITFSSDNDEESAQKILNEESDIYSGGEALSPLQVLSIERIRSFLNALSNNHTFDGAYRLSDDNSRSIYCTCSTSMKKLVSHFCLEYIISDDERGVVNF